MNKGFFMAVNHLFIADHKGIFAAADGYRLNGRCQGFFKLSLDISRKVRAFIKRNASGSQLHSKGKTGGKATFTAILFAAIRKLFYNISSFQRHRNPPSL